MNVHVEGKTFFCRELEEGEVLILKFIKWLYLIFRVTTIGFAQDDVTDVILGALKVSESVLIYLKFYIHSDIDSFLENFSFKSKEKTRDF